MKRRHFSAFAPRCPVCAARGLADGAPLVIGTVEAEQDGDISAGILHCPLASCQYEFPIVDGIPVIVPDLAGLMAQRGVDFFLRDDLPESLESLLGDALGPDGWLDALRQGFSTYAWDAYGDLAPDAPNTGLLPGAARRCLRRLLDLAGAGSDGAMAIDVGCAAGRTSLDLATHMPQALVLGVDTNFGLLRIARAAAAGRVRYPLRRIGIVYDRQDFAVSLPDSCRVDFWAVDALALPLASGSMDVVSALNLLDCVAEPQRLLTSLAAPLRPGGSLLLATPFDWSTRATPPAHWIGGHSQRADHAGRAEAFLRTLLEPLLTIVGEDTAWPWHTRLHERGFVQYVAHLVAARRKQGLLF